MQKRIATANGRLSLESFITIITTIFLPRFSPGEPILEFICRSVLLLLRSTCEAVEKDEGK